MILRSQIAKRNQKRNTKRNHKRITKRRNSFSLNLSDEVMIKIFSFLNHHDLMNNIPLVCKRWNRLSQDPSYWKSLSLNYKRIKRLRWIKILSKCRFIIRLNIKYYKITQRSPLNYLKNLRHLQHLILQHCHFTEIEKRIFEPLLNKNIPCIIWLALRCCTNTNEFLKQITDLKTLQCLEIIDYDTISREALNNVLENCTNLIYIRIMKLNVDVGDFKNEAINSIFRIRSDTLEKVALHVDCNDDSFINLGDCLNIKSLIIINCSNVSDNTLFLIKKLRNLNKLFLSFCANFTSAGFKKMFKDGEMKNLTHFTICVCPGLSNSNLESIAKFCPNLVCFRLICCRNINDGGIESIINHCSSLVQLEIRNCICVTENFIKNISSDNLIKLEELSLNEEFERKECVKLLREKRPLLKLLFESEEILDEYFYD